MAKKNRCIVCSSQSIEPLDFFYSRYLPKFFHRIGICRDCGHIQVFELFNKKTIKYINDGFFNSSYLKKNKSNKRENLIKLKKLNQRLKNEVKEGMNILDIGAGEGWALDYFKEKSCNYYAIEAVPKLRSAIQKRGGEIIGSDIFSNYKNYDSFFNIIIFRHIIEHLDNPKKDVKPSKGFKTSFLRPVHISYFHPKNVIRIAHESGLEPKVFNNSGEIFTLLSHKSNKKLTYKNLYKIQKKTFKKTSKKFFFTDMFKIAKDLPIAVTQRILNKLKFLMKIDLN